MFLALARRLGWALKERSSWRQFSWGPALGSGGWSLITWLLVGLLCSPLPILFWIALEPAEPLWEHLATTLLPLYARTSLLLGVGVGGSVLCIGAGCAWLVGMCNFPGRKFLQWALLLPLAMPAYLAAFAYTDWLEYAGPLQSGLRSAFGWRNAREYWFPEVRSLGGAVIFLSLVLYPYVYLLARQAFVGQSRSVVEVGRSLGQSPWRCFWKLGLPLARPALAAGVLIALMETWSDFGTVEFFAVPTFTVGIYRMWFAMGNSAAAAQLALALLGLVFSGIFLERYIRGRRRFHTLHGGPQNTTPPFPLHGAKAFCAACACCLPVLLGFVLPTGLLLHKALRYAELESATAFLLWGWNSVRLAAIAAALCVGIGIFFAYAARVHRRGWKRVALRAAGMGYAIPGTVLALVVLIPFAAFDNALDRYLRENFGVSSGLLLSGSLAAVLFAYVVRFTALALNACEAALNRVTPHIDQSARSLGAGRWGVLLRVHLPLLRGGMWSAWLLVFVDCMKELPLTLMLRPFNFDTLATKVFEYASFERFPQAAPAALLIVALSTVPVALLSRAQLSVMERPAAEEKAGTLQ